MTGRGEAMPDRAEIGRRVEAIVASALRGVGWHVLNLDEEHS
jgi:hypothetical protein